MVRMTYLARAAQSLKWSYRYWRNRYTHPLYPRFAKENLADALMYLRMALTGKRGLP